MRNTLEPFFQRSCNLHWLNDKQNQYRLQIVSCIVWHKAFTQIVYDLLSHVTVFHSSAEPHPVDWREKFDCPCGSWHRRPRLGEIGKYCSSIHIHPVKELTWMWNVVPTIKLCNHSHAGCPCSVTLGTLCSEGLTVFREEFETGAECWRGKIREWGCGSEQMASSS